MFTTFDDVRDLLKGSKTTGLLDWWERTYPEKMRGFVTQFRHEALYKVAPEDVLHTTTISSHALGLINVKENIPTTRDAHIDYAMEYLFHGLLEHLGHLPSWDEFWDDMRGQRAKF